MYHQLKMKYLLIFALLIILQTGVDSSHFRGGDISYTVTEVSGQFQVHFTILHAWRADAPDSIGFQFGDGGYMTYGPTDLIFSGLDSEGEAYNVYHVDAYHTYATAGVYYAYWESCCRIYTVLNSESSNFRVRAIVDLTPAVPLNSPTANLPPLIQMPISATSTYQIGAADPNGFTCALTSSTDDDIDSVASINGNQISVSSSCLLSWNSVGANVGDKYAVSVSVYQTGTQTVIPLDFIIELIPLSYLPTFQVVPYNPVVVLGQAFSVTVTGTSGRPNVNALTLSVLGLAGDATVTPPPSTTGAIPFQVFFQSAAQIPGSFSTVIVFSDPNNYQSTYTISYSVIKPSECAEVSFTNCDTQNGVTYYDFSSNPNANYEFANNCSGTYQNSSGTFTFASTQAGGPNTVCNFSLAISETVGGSVQVASCVVDLSCPLCSSVTQSGPVRTICRNDSASIYTVGAAESVDRYLNGDVLATAVDPDGSIVSTTTSTLPPGVSVAANGEFYVSSRPSLIAGTYAITVTTTDIFGGVTTQVVTLVFYNVVCGSGLSPCGAACYDPTVSSCVPGINSQSMLCPINNIYCPGSSPAVCYDPTQNVCQAGTLCQVGTGICGGGCYPPAILSCNLAPGGAYVLCPTFLGFCGSGCYDPTSFDCINGGLQPKGIASCNGVNYDPNTYDCVSSNFICPTGDSVCGTACYDKTQYTCQPNLTLCQFGQELCGTTCYDDTKCTCQNASTNTITCP